MTGVTSNNLRCVGWCYFIGGKAKLELNFNIFIDTMTKCQRRCIQCIGGKNKQTATLVSL